MNYYNATSGTSGATTIVQLPLAFVRSGHVNVGDGKVYYVGYSGYGRSRTSLSSANAYNLYTNPGNVNPSNNGNRYIGRSLRCRTHGRKRRAR